MKYRTKSYFCPKCLKTLTVYAPTIATVRMEYEQAINKHSRECWLTPVVVDEYRTCGATDISDGVCIERGTRR